LTTLVLLQETAEARSKVEQNICREIGSYAVFARQGILGGDRGRDGSFADQTNSQRAHEQIFFCNEGKIVENIGFGFGKPDIQGLPVSGTGARFSYTANDIQRGIARADGSRLDTFAPIDGGRIYDPRIIKKIIGFLPSACTLQDDGRYSGIGNNCQNWTANVRKEYWKYPWNLQHTGFQTDGQRCSVGASWSSKITLYQREDGLRGTVRTVWNGVWEDTPVIGEISGRTVRLSYTRGFTVTLKGRIDNDFNIRGIAKGCGSTQGKFTITR
jgi:hypothetical protein